MTFERVCVMKTIISILAKAPFNFVLSAEDIRIYEQILKDYQQHMADDTYSILFANITFMLSNRIVLDVLLSHLEADVKREWNPHLTVHQPNEYIECIGLTWPVPNADLYSNHSQHLLSRVLLRMEQTHGINRNKDDAPVPTLFGYIENNLVQQLINKNELWNDDTTISGLIFHGKSTHRIQLYLVMKAIDINLLQVNDLKMKDLLAIFLNTRTRFDLTLAWDLLFDNTHLPTYSQHNSYNVDDPVFNALSEKYQHRIKSGQLVDSYVYGCDPYYLHSYLMTYSRAKTPCLSECVTQSFAKTARIIQKIEAEIGQKIENEAPVFLTRERKQCIKQLNQDEFSMRHVLKRQEEVFVLSGEHVVNEKSVKDYLTRHGKMSRVLAAVGNIEYRGLFVKQNSVDTSESERKRAKL